jgi:hypothetical protein
MLRLWPTLSACKGREEQRPLPVDWALDMVCEWTLWLAEVERSGRVVEWSTGSAGLDETGCLKETSIRATLCSTVYSTALARSA